MAFSHAFSTQIGVSGSNVETIVESMEGSKKHFQEGEVVRLKVKELLDTAGIHLDERNANSRGNKPLEDMDWPIYRMTGKI